MTAPDYEILRGDWFIRERGATPWHALGDIKAATNAMTASTSEMTSYGNTPGTIATALKSVSSKLTLKMRRLQKLDLALYMQGLGVDETAEADKTFTCGALAVGETYVLPDSFVANLVVKDGSTDCSAKVSIVGNTITALEAITNLNGTYDKLAAEGVGMLNAIQKQFELYFVSTQGFVGGFYLWQPEPGSLNLIAEDFLECDVAGALLKDPQKSASAVYGQYGYLKRAK